MHKRDAWCKTQIQKFIECYKYFDSNLPNVLHESTFYENDNLFAVEFQIDNKVYVGMSNSDSISSQLDFLLKSYLKFINKNRDVLETLNKVFPYLSCLFFNPLNFYYHYQTRDLRCNFSQALPLLFMGGIIRF
jgi:hypothetical protein